MCLAFVAIDAHPRYPLVIAANRDEYHARVAQPAHWWPEGILAGRDLDAGGTWLGVSRQGRWAFVTNVRDAGRNDKGAPSRGSLVVDALRDPQAPMLAAAAALRGPRRNGFNLLVGDRASASYASNRASGVLMLEPGIHGLSNYLLDSDWPKVTRGRNAFQASLAGKHADIESLFAQLRDVQPAAKADLPHTGVPLEWEQRLSSAFIVTPAYGTRCSTIVTLARDGVLRFIERSFDAGGAMREEVAHEFALAA